ncbi:bifunctional riboflavin kinase/FAD synthetase [Bacillus carboniphilus]|uniref:Riboflavin biosynthesis protein n=1 Tax=Bacillus carboniphilus TaxID=86663 RepID=A0ABP3G0M0_9BACI
MEVISVSYPHSYNKEDFQESAMAIGFFDGVHLGHQKVIKTAIEYAKAHNMKSAVMTFDPHPSVVLGKNVQNVEMITPMQEKIEQIRALGVDYLFVVNFSEAFSKLQPQEFVDQFIIGLNVQHVVAGFDFSYGRFGKGKMDTLPEFSRGKFTQTTVEKYEKEEIKVSSTAIRSFLKEGRMDKVKEFLGRYYSVKGTVIHGHKRGRQIGFPTANIKLDQDSLKPPVGVYAVQVQVKGQWYIGVCNFGYKPTFDDGPLEPQAEVHIFDFSEDIYGETIVVRWHKRLRDEKKFPDIDELIRQIKQDAEDAKAFFRE